MSKPSILLPEHEKLKTLPMAEIALRDLAVEINQMTAAAEAASDIAAAYIRAESAGRQLEPLYKTIAAILNAIATVTLPERFDNNKTTSVTALGYRATVSQLIRTSIRKDAKEETFSWLKENGHGDIIKIEPTIHPETLAAWARQQLEDGEDLPESLFSIFYYQNTSLTKANRK